MTSGIDGVIMVTEIQLRDALQTSSSGLIDIQYRCYLDPFSSLWW